MLANYRDLLHVLSVVGPVWWLSSTLPQGLVTSWPAQQIFDCGGGGGGMGRRLNANGKREPTREDRGACSPIPENFDFNSSKMTGNAFKNNKLNV